jgi:hypothetical protein
MSRVLDPFPFVLIAIAGWMNQHQQFAIDYPREDNRVLREQLGGGRLNDDQRRRLAAKAKGLGRKLLAERVLSSVHNALGYAQSQARRLRIEKLGTRTAELYFPQLRTSCSNDR